MKKIEQRTLNELIDLHEKATAAVEAYAAALSELAESMRAYFDDRSESWQESDTVSGWVEAKRAAD
jgi:hypothetical protein